MDGPVYQKVVITAIKEEAGGVRTFVVRYDNGASISYIAGQFITLVFNHHQREERRSFSISSSPAVGEDLAFTVKRIDNGAYSRLLTDKAKAGDILYTTGVAGLFTLPADIGGKQLFFFAAGIGITPVFSLIKAALASNDDARSVLVYSNRSQEEVVFYDALNMLAAQYKERLAIEYLYSDSFDLNKARLNKALVKTLLSEHAIGEKDDMLFYVCGPHDYMRMVIYALEESGIKDAQIRREHFNMNARPAAVSEPPDKERHNITFLHNGQARSITSQYPETILKAAKRNNIQLPYSCEAGRCGSCALLCRNGKVWHAYNEVLMDMDLLHGSILTCTGYPVGGDITLEL